MENNLEENKNSFSGKKMVIIFLLLLVFIIGGSFIFYLINKKAEVEIVVEEDVVAKDLDEEKENDKASLPSFDEMGENGIDGQQIDSEFEIQKISFGDFYKTRKENINLKADEYKLPLNVKVDVANYYDVSRRINIDKGIGDLNENGFAIIDNSFEPAVDNFYSGFKVLREQGIPVLITSDFLTYYYQNRLKNVFKDIEASVFYETLWETSLRLYKISKDRYETQLSDVGVINDVYLEGARKELAFFATILKLLSPADNQISNESQFSDNDLFSSVEANNFSISLPSYLKKEVEEEIHLINEAEVAAKSPILLFERDYEKFKIPKVYQVSARLSNFYKASLLINSNFPLFFRDNDCKDCFLDKDDWRISMCAASLISADLSDNQDLQNNWAKIYKLKSFFQGLLADLNYLHYDNVFNDVFGEEKKVSDIFSSSKDEIDLNLEKLQLALFEKDFLEIEGGMDKESTSTKKELGMKMLTQAYWPNDFIFDQLTYPEVGLFVGGDDVIDEKINNTNCRIDKNYYRCFGFGFDILSLVYDVSKENSSYVSENINYENYDNKLSFLKEQIAEFGVYKFHSNVYWSNLDIFGKVLNSSRDLDYITMRGDAYRGRNIGLSLASLVNLQLPADTLSVLSDENISRLGDNGIDTSAINYSYIEPNIFLVRELIANSEMILDMLSLLEVSKYENNVISDLNNLKSNLKSIEDLIKKELRGESFSEEDFRFIADFTKEFEVVKSGEKQLVFESEYERGKLVQSIEGIKFLIFTYRKDDKNFFAVGPIFNYWEDYKR